MNRLLLLLALAPFLSCGGKKKKEDTGPMFPVLSYLKSQARHVDTSLYRLVKIETANGRSDTSYIAREAFKTYAAAFLQLPDISSPKWSDDYEETRMFDDMLNNSVLTYTTTEEDNEVRRADVVIDGMADAEGNTPVNTIIIHQVKQEGGNTVSRNMVWYVNKRFTIITKTGSAQEPEQIKKLEIIWNDFPEGFGTQE